MMNLVWAIFNFIGTVLLISLMVAGVVFSANALNERHIRKFMIRWIIVVMLFSLAAWYSVFTWEHLASFVWILF